MKYLPYLFVLLGSLLLFAGSCEFTTTPHNIPAPEFSPGGGSYASAQTVTITCATAGTEIRYTTNGSDPTETSTLYAAPVVISSTKTLKAKAFKGTWNSSPIAMAVYTISSLPAGLILVQGGTFYNGVANVTLSDFYLDKYEVTQAGYTTVMGSSSAHFNTLEDGPEDSVSWFHAIEYCNRRSTQSGLTPCYTYSGHGTDPDGWPAGWDTNYLNQANIICNWTVSGYRLPTEMEWEFAARGGNSSNGYNFSGSNVVSDVAWYSVNSGDHTHAVGIKTPNELGFYDMSGNVFEWVWDGYADYPATAQTNPHGPATSDSRVRRGGSYNEGSGWANVSFRNGNSAIYSGYIAGFRVCRNP